MSIGSRSVWRSRAVLFAVLGLLLLGNVAVLITHSVFYDARLRALQADRAELARKRDEARASADKVAENARRLNAQREALDRFYAETLGSRKERLAPLIEEIYATTKKTGFAVDDVSYQEESVPGARRLALSFNVTGSYADVKKLLAAFENNPGFLVLETVTVGTDEKAPDLLKVSLVLSHYFREEGGPAVAAARRAARESR